MNERPVIYSLPPFFSSQRRGLLQFQGNPKTKRENIKSTEIKIRIKIKSIRSINIVTKIKIAAKIRTKRRRRIEVGIMILVAITRRNTMKRYSSRLQFSEHTECLGNLLPRSLLSSKCLDVMYNFLAILFLSPNHKQLLFR